MEIEELNYCKDLAIEAANLAFDRLRKLSDTSRKVELNLPRDVKIIGDRETENAIVKVLSDGSPYPTLAEESGLNGAIELYKWVVDPIDGSYNFSRGIPHYYCSIALCKGNTPLVGVVKNYVNGDIYTGIVGQGATLNNNPIKVSSVNSKKNATLCTGFPVASTFTANSVNQFVTKVNSYKKIRSFGSAAFSLSLVASGSVDAYHEENIRLWDVAAGIALVKAAGGTVEVSRVKNDDTTLNVRASNGRMLL